MVVANKKKSDTVLSFSRALPEQKLVATYNTARAKIKDSGAPVIHYVSAYNGEGAVRIALETALLAAEKLNQKVLFIDGCLRLPKTLQIFLAVMKGAQARQIHQIEDSRFFFCRLYPQEAKQDDILPEQEITHLIESQKDQFDVMILCSEGALENETTLSLSRMTDATILIVEAEQTRKPVALQLKNALQENGANIVGTILNRRRFHIPGFIHRLFFANAKSKES